MVVDSCSFSPNSYRFSDTYSRHSSGTGLRLSGGIEMNIEVSIPEKLQILGDKIKRMNQLVLVFPVWSVLGLSGFFKRKGSETGWSEREKNTEWGKMY